MKNHRISWFKPVQAMFILIFLGAVGVAHAGGLVAAWGDNSYEQTTLTLPIGVNQVKAIAAGAGHSLALKSDGTVIAWGDNAYGETTVPINLSKVTAVAAGNYYSLALKADGTVVGWGVNWSGVIDVPAGLSNVVAIAAAEDHSLALKADGTVAGWGDDVYGESDAPAGLSNVTAIAAGGWHSLALRADGTIIGWGADGAGQADIPSGLSNVVAIAAGESHSLALNIDGTVVAWGWDGDGETDVPQGLSNVVAIAAGADQSLALKADGTVVAWGDQTNVPAGLSEVTAIAAGGFYGSGSYSLALVFNGPIQVTQNPQSQGVPYTSNATFSVVASGAQPLSYQWFLNGTALSDNSRVNGSTNASLSISNAQFGDIGTYTIVVSNAFGSVISSGAVLTVISPPFLTQPSATNQTVPAGTDVTLSVSAQGTPLLSYQWLFNGTNLSGATNTALLLTNVQPGASGDYSLIVTNLYGSTQIDLTLTVTDSPPYVLTQPAGQSVAVGQSITLSVSARGSLPLNYQWHFNGANISGATNAALALTNLNCGQTGYYDVAISNPFGEIVSAKVLLNVVQSYLWGNFISTSPTNEPPGLSNVVAIAAGGYHVLALKRDGTVVTWGSSASQFSVTNVPPGVTNVIAIAASGNSSMVLKSNGTVVVWGDNASGQTNVPPAATNVMAIADSDYGSGYCLALKSNGTVIGWGNGPKVPAALSNIVAIAAGSTFGLALKNDGTLVTWGNGPTGGPPGPAVPPGLTNVIAISANTTTCLALKVDGTIIEWGSGPKTPAGLSNVVAIAAGPAPGAALKSDGTVVSWGITVGNSNSFPSSVSNVIAMAISSPFGIPFLAAVVGDGSPFITLQPASQATTNGANVQFHARAVGAQPLFYNQQKQQQMPRPLSYQWQFKGAILPGATNADVTITNVQGTNTGNYQVVVTNGLGVVTSRIAQLTIPFSTNLASALNATNLVWISSPTNAPWFAETFVTHDGDTAAQSGAIGNSQQSILLTSVTGPGTLTFWWKVSSEEGYDFLNFYEDNTNTPLARISGEVDWQQESFAVASGTHLLEWIYAKDASVSAGQDAGWLDQVVFTPDPPIIALQPLSQTNGMGSSATFQAAASGAPALNFQWLKNGTNLPNAQSAILTLTNLTRRDSGAYALQVSNASGSTTSSNATLIVIVPQRLGAPAFLPDGGFGFVSGDADGGLLLPGDLAGFEAQASTNLADWVTLTNALKLTNGQLELHDADSTNHAMRFYRVLEH